MFHCRWVTVALGHYIIYGIFTIAARDKNSIFSILGNICCSGIFIGPSSSDCSIHIYTEYKSADKQHPYYQIFIYCHVILYHIHF